MHGQRTTTAQHTFIAMAKHHDNTTHGLQKRCTVLGHFAHVHLPHRVASTKDESGVPVSYTHLRAHETSAHL
eukprot:15360100-Alexandrium_andersonii.AAC.1